MDRIKIEMEFLLKASPAIVYQFLTTPACLVRWFCDSVEIIGEEYHFSWNGSTETAEMIDDIEEERVRFRWEYADDDEYLEFRIYKAEITEDTVLEITDFCDADEEKEQKDLWSRQVTQLKVESGG